MSKPIQFENDSFKAEVWPQFGGRVTSLVDKADGYELLYSYPAELPTGSLYDTSYIDGWHAGWDECFPAVSASHYQGHPYDNIRVPDHGEIWGLPTTAVPNKSGITTVWHGLRFGYRLTRKLSLEARAVVAQYTLINLAPFDFYFVWAQHALLAMKVPMQLELPAMEGDPAEFSDLDALPAGQSWKRFSQAPIVEPARIVFPTRHRQLEISFTSDASLAAHWSLWINTGGWARHRHVAFLPTIGRADALDEAIRDGSAGVLAAMGRAEWSVRWAVSPA